MNVPPSHKLIVCVIPPQTIVRQCVLAAVSYASVLCGAANAQLAPAAPSLTLWNAVELSHGTEVEKTYIVEHSSDLSLWSDTGPATYGNGEDVAWFQPADASPQGYYRLKVHTLPAEGKARWSMNDCRMVFNSANGFCGMVFGDDNTGTMAEGERITSFIWDWKRSGPDQGLVTLTWPGGAVETMELQFLDQHSGAFTSQRTIGGIPAAASSGTFREDYSSVVARHAPSSILNSLVTFSGSGRPLGLEISATGSATLPGPATARTFASSSYTVTGASARLVLTGNGGVTETWLLAFTGPSCGTYTGMTARNGTLRRNSRGSFTIARR